VVDVCVVEVDRETGAVEVLDYVTVHDAGVILNPLLADGQVVGGFAHGAAVALHERHGWDEWGNPQTASFVDYLAPTARDVPPIRVGHHASPSPFTALGAKGIGEGSTMSAPCAIANAVADAIGRDDVELPLTAPRVWELLHATESEGEHGVEA
jgi:2-furoyl-CoA dehydrogenase large subunit